MNIRSIDLQVAIPRSTDASRIQQVTEHLTILQQQEFADDSQRMAIKKQQQVHSKPKSEGVKVEERKEPQEHHRNKQDGGKHEFLGKMEPDVTIGTDPVRGTRIDIKT